jgi:hypothetical protein
MDSGRKIRIIFDLGLIFSAVFLPWWFVIILLILGISIFDSYYEAFLIAFFIDSVYSISREFFYGISFIYFLIILIFYFLIDLVKMKLRF